MTICQQIFKPFKKIDNLNSRRLVLITASLRCNVFCACRLHFNHFEVGSESTLGFVGIIMINDVMCVVVNENVVEDKN